MKVVRSSVSFGKKLLSFRLSANRLLGILQGRKTSDKDVTDLLKNSLDTPSNRNTLKRLISGKHRALIVVPDATRKAHLSQILPELIGRIRQIEQECAVDIIVATGMHKPLTKGQLEELLSGSVIKACRILQHSQLPDALVAKGITQEGVPIVLNRCLDKYEVILSIGVIEPHLYAGYSGGAKTVAIGLAGEATIKATHSIRFFDDARVTIGSIRDNPFQKSLWGIIKGSKIDFSVNIVNDPAGRALKIFSGETKRVFTEGADFAGSVFEVKVKKAADITICGIGYPKDVNLYQASRAVNYVANTARPVVRKGGVVIIAAQLKDGAGRSEAERRFHGRLKTMRSGADFIAMMKRGQCEVGDHRAYMVAKAMLDYKIIFVTAARKPEMIGLPFPVFQDMASALKAADAITGKASKIYVIPRALSTIADIG